MYKIFTFLTLIISISTYSQNKCDCSKVLSYVSEQIESNSASFAHQVTEYNRKKEYLKHKKLISKIAKKVDTEKECLGKIQLYLSFLRDNHQELSITDKYYPFTSFNDSISVKKFIKDNVENFKIKGNNSNELLGTWFYKDGTFSVEIQKNLNKGRSFIGAITDKFVNDGQYLANKGDLKIEFYRNYKDELYAVYWSFGQKPSGYKVEITKNTLRLGISLVFYKDQTKTKLTENYKIKNSTFLEELSNETNYLRIHTFDYENKKNIDSILLVNKDKLASKKNLIIDVRNNGGGSDYSYYPLLPYVMDKNEYQNPIAASSIWVSKDNFHDYYNERYLYDVYTKQDSLNADNEIEQLRKNIGKFEPYTKSTSKIEDILPLPKKVFILQNRWDASSTEGFILTSKQSGKVKTYGENTGGFVSYGEWRKLEIPNFPAWISMTQKKMIFYDDSDFEMIGIEPDIKLNPDDEKNWINIVKTEIEK
jgi:hypothetical protein